MDVKRVIAATGLLVIGIGIFVTDFPVIGRPASILLNHPIIAFLLLGWYLGRPAIAMGAQWFHYRWRDSLDEDVEPPSLSVLIPAYNEENQVTETVEHIFAQDYPGEIEIVIVDDGSTDGTWEVLQGLAAEYPEVVVDTKTNGGIGETQNAALAYATNEVVVNIDADTHLEPGALTEMTNVFRDEEMVAVGGNLGVLNPSASVWTRVQAFEYGVAMELARMFQSRLRHLLCVSGGFGAFRRETLAEIGGWNEEDTISEDFELSVRMHEKGRVWFTPTAVALTEVPETLHGWWRQRVRWARNGLRTLIRRREAQFNPSFSLAGLFGLPLKAFFSIALLWKVGSWGVELLTGEMQVGPSLVFAIVAVFAITTPLSLVLLGLLTTYATNLRMLRSWPWIAVYATIYRPLHIAVKLTGFLRAFLIETKLLVERAIERETTRKPSNESVTDRSDD